MSAFKAGEPSGFVPWDSAEGVVIMHTCWNRLREVQWRREVTVSDPQRRLSETGRKGNNDQVSDLHVPLPSRRLHVVKVRERSAGAGVAFGG